MDATKLKFNLGNRESLDNVDAVSGSYYQTSDTGQLFLGIEDEKVMEIGNLIQDEYGNRESLKTRQGENNLSIGPSSLILNSTDSTANGWRTVIIGSSNSIIPRTSDNVGIISSSNSYIDIPPVKSVKTKSEIPSGDTGVYYVADEGKYYKNGAVDGEAGDKKYDYIIKLGQSLISASANSKITSSGYIKDGNADYFGGTCSIVSATSNSELSGLRSFIIGGYDNKISHLNDTCGILNSTSSNINESTASRSIIINSDDSKMLGAFSGSSLINCSNVTAQYGSNVTAIGLKNISISGATDIVMTPNKIRMYNDNDTYTELVAHNGSTGTNTLFLPDVDYGTLATTQDIPSITPVLESGVVIAAVSNASGTTLLYAPNGGGSSFVNVTEEGSPLALHINEDTYFGGDLIGEDIKIVSNRSIDDMSVPTTMTIDLEGGGQSTYVPGTMQVNGSILVKSIESSSAGVRIGTIDNSTNGGNYIASTINELTLSTTTTSPSNPGKLYIKSSGGWAPGSIYLSPGIGQGPGALTASLGTIYAEGNLTINGTSTSTQIPTLNVNGSIMKNGVEVPVVSWDQTVTTGTKIATITLDGVATNIYAPKGGGGEGGSTVEVTQVITEGVETASIDVDGVSTSIYIPDEITADEVDALFADLED